MRTRSTWWTLLATILITVLAAARATAADPPYLLALGDSLAVGVEPNASGTLVSTNEGYVDDLFAFYRLRIPGLRVAKLGCSGETTSAFISGLGSNCVYPRGSQLQQALHFLTNHRVVLITIDIGGDNLLQCFSLSSPIDPACVSGAGITAGNDLAAILGTVRAAAPQTLIVGANYYDPFLAAFVFGPQGQALAAASLVATTAFNQVLTNVYQALEAPFADVAGVFRIQDFPANVIRALSWTWISAPPPRGPDVHPNAIGYLAIASAFSKAIAGP